MRLFLHIVVILVLTTGLPGCDTVEPSRGGTLVLEAYVQAGKPLPNVRITRTSDPSVLISSVSNAVTDADVELTIDQSSVRYTALLDSPGMYRPEDSTPPIEVRAFSEFLLSVRAGEDQASASGVVPPPIKVLEVSLDVALEAIEAILIDTLNIGIDSLDLGLNAQQGYIYPVQVTLAWQSLTPDVVADNNFWIETRLEPANQFSSTLIDFFLLPKQVLPEGTLAPNNEGALTWSGVYAVPVESPELPVPEHTLKVSLLRGDQSFALFESSRDSPEQREPVSNVRGGLGYVGGISVDTLRIPVQ